MERPRPSLLSPFSHAALCDNQYLQTWTTQRGSRTCRTVGGALITYVELKSRVDELPSRFPIPNFQFPSPSPVSSLPCQKSRLGYCSKVSSLSRRRPSSSALRPSFRPSVSHFAFDSYLRSRSPFLNSRPVRRRVRRPSVGVRGSQWSARWATPKCWANILHSLVISPP